ncbi:DUF721 domain-containing protein [Agromyces archimandritae]|uniref:DUF721 domain-containing protein n=1 Tax=Agromyces archimandritae TaxID=2781962 RepID=A0A975FPS6_9MICO|nr:DciA family protein [Agromyces archimandritae]QTX06054.1 DUF721 domain-containing protein [Agromyces archimandritae]
MPEPGPQTEAERVYRHFREIFGGDGRAPSRRRRERRTPEAELPFAPGRDPRALGDALDALTTQLGWTAPLARHELLASWPEVAGAEIAKHSEPVGIEGGMMTVRCESTAWATQLRLMRTELVSRVVDRFPDSGVESMRFQGPDAPSWKRGPRSVPGRGPRDTYG